MERLEQDEYRSYLWVALADWERLRLLYNLVLLVFGLQHSWHLRDVPGLLGGAYLGGVILFGVVANAFYCLGPLADVYLLALRGHALGRDRRILFGVGLIFSLIVVGTIGGAL